MQPGTPQVWRRLAPFAVSALLAFLALEPGTPPASAWFPPAFWLAAAVLALGALAPQRARGAWRPAQLGYLGVVPASWFVHPDLGAAGFTALGLLPVLWLVLYAPRPPLTAALLTGVALPAWAIDVPRAAFWAVVVVAVALAVQRLVEQAGQRADLLAEHAHVLCTVAGLARRTDTGPAVRQAICSAAATATRADLAYLVEPGERGHWTSTAASVPGLPKLTIASGELRRGLTAPGPSLAAAGATALGVQPVCRDGVAVAVLVVGWRTAEVGVQALEALDLLAAEASAALERADLLASLAAEARHDPLTGLANRRAWDERLAQELARARRLRRPLSVALLDLDLFKAYNDRYGHQTGDLLLKQAAVAWRGELRATDLLARWGGEEFAVLLPACSAAEALLLLERLRARTPGGQTCSAGIAEWIPGEDGDTLLRRADMALYQAKRTGRDRAVSALVPVPDLVVDLSDPLTVD